MKTIPLNGKLGNGLVILIDDADFEKVAVHKWWVLKKRHTNYAYTMINGKAILLHRFILNPSTNTVVDHYPDHNGLNCQRSNMRLCSVADNNHNMRNLKGGSSQFKGVSWDKRNRHWRSRIGVYGRYVHIGYFVNEESAAKAYDKAAKTYFGEFANINFK